MSVIVKNMEMPDRCGRCFFVRWSNLYQTARCTLTQEACFENFSTDYKNRRADFCPLVEIPPHGRLIDADKFKADYSMKNDCTECEKELRGSSRACEYDRIYSKMDFCDWIDIAPTVIEAEGSET